MTRMSAIAPATNSRRINPRRCRRSAAARSGVSDALVEQALSGCRVEVHEPELSLSQRHAKKTTWAVAWSALFWSVYWAARWIVWGFRG